MIGKLSTILWSQTKRYAMLSASKSVSFPLCLSVCLFSCPSASNVCWSVTVSLSVRFLSASGWLSVCLYQFTSVLSLLLPFKLISLLFTSVPYVWKRWSNFVLSISATAHAWALLYFLLVVRTIFSGAEAGLSNASTWYKMSDMVCSTINSVTLSLIWKKRFLSNHQYVMGIDIRIS